MKKLILLILVLGSFISLSTAQTFNYGADVMSTYIWRGQQYGSSPITHPKFIVTDDRFNLGVSSYHHFNDEQYHEFNASLDVKNRIDENKTISYCFNYYLIKDNVSPTQNLFEPMARFDAGIFQTSLGFMFNSSVDSTTFYWEGKVDLPLGEFIIAGGDGFYTEDGNFGLCNLTYQISPRINFIKDLYIEGLGGVTYNPSFDSWLWFIGVSVYFEKKYKWGY